MKGQVDYLLRKLIELDEEFTQYKEEELRERMESLQGENDRLRVERETLAGTMKLPPGVPADLENMERRVQELYKLSLGSKPKGT